MPDEPMTLIERLRNPAYVTNPAGGDALLDTKRTLTAMRLAALLIEEALRRGKQTNRGPMLTAEQKKLARHALGLVDGNKKSYRNRYRAPYIGAAAVAWHQMKDDGLATCDPAPAGSTLGPMFYLTEAGARLALEPGESLCREDFPQQPAR